MDFLRNPIWQYILVILRDPLWQFVGVVIAIVTLFVAIVLYLKQRNLKCITYKVLLKTSRVDNPVVICLRIWNSGNVPISRSEYDHPIRFGFKEPAPSRRKDPISFSNAYMVGWRKNDFQTTGRVLDATIVWTKPKSLKESASITWDAESLTLDPLMLNKGDTLDIEVHLTRFCIITPSGRVVGVKDVSKKPRTFLENIILDNEGVS